MLLSLFQQRLVRCNAWRIGIKELLTMFDNFDITWKQLCEKSIYRKNDS